MNILLSYETCKGFGDTSISFHITQLINTCHIVLLTAEFNGRHFDIEEAVYGVLFVRIREKIDCFVTAPHCILEKNLPRHNGTALFTVISAGLSGCKTSPKRTVFGDGLISPLRYGCSHLKWVIFKRTVYPNKYAHGFCFAVLCCGYTLTDFPTSIRLTSLALWQSNDCPSASKATLMNMDKYFMWINYERLHNHNKTKHNKTVCIFLGIYCISWIDVWIIPDEI